MKTSNSPPARQSAAVRVKLSRGRHDHSNRIVDFEHLDPDADNEAILNYFIEGVQELIEADPEEALFQQEVIEVEELFAQGRISPIKAAARLGLSLREFVSEFVFDEESFTHIEPKAREALINNAVNALTEARAGRSIREFIRESVFGDTEFEVCAGTDDEESVRLKRSVDSLSTASLGIELRQALSVGYSLREFVEISIFNKAWREKAGLDDASLAAMISRTITAIESAEEYILNMVWFSALAVRGKEISNRLIERITYAISRRRMRDARDILELWDNRRVLVSAPQANAGVLLNQYAQWIDFDFSYLQLVETAIQEFHHQLDNDLTPRDLAHLEMAEALVHLHNEDYNKAIVHLKYAMKRGHSIMDLDLLVMCLYFLGRSYLRKGKYLKALRYAGRARKRNEKLDRPERGAAIALLEGWSVFHLGDLKKAKHLQQHAKQTLRWTDDFVSKGDARSLNGRLLLLLPEEGQPLPNEEHFEQALGEFDNAIWQYQRWDSKHRNIARAYVNMADICFLHARRLSSDPVNRPRVLQLRLQAFEYLEAAEEIYLREPERNHRGLGKLHNMRAFLYTAAGEFDRARAEAERAYFFGSLKNDHLLMGKAKRNQWSITDERRSRARYGQDEPQDETITAWASADEALRHALATDDRRLQARCYLYLGHSVLRLDRDHVSAQDFHTKACDCLSHSQRKDDPWKDKLKRLEEAIEECKAIPSDGETQLV